MRNLDGVGLNVSDTRLRELSLAAQSRYIKLLKDSVISTIIVNTLKLDILAILAQGCPESIRPTEFRNWELKLLHKEPNYLINLLVDD